METLKIKSAVKCGYEVGGVGDSVNLTAINSHTRRGRIGHKICNTLDTQCAIGVIVEDECKTDREHSR